jgi:hypothetical protein
MLRQLLTAAVLLAACVAIHAAGTRTVLHRVARHATRTGEIRVAHPWLRLAAAFVFIFALHAAEMTLWAAVYIGAGAFGDLEQALYFSVVSYTTVGYGDVVLPPRWRILGAAEAATGTLLFGWSTGLLFALIARLYRLGA